MAFREVRVFEVREVLRLWLANEGFRSIERLSQVDRKTVRRYVEAAAALGLDRAGGDDQLDDLFIGQVVEAVRPHRVDGHGEAWRVLVSHHDQIKAWLDDDLTAVKIHELLGRRGVAVPLRTVQRYVNQVCERTRGQDPTVRVVDGEPGESSRSTSAGSAWSSTPTPVATGSAGRCCSPPATPATSSSG